jgi:transcriptional regulator with XRE-family HTH domain
MTAQERLVDGARRRAREELAAIAREIRDARLSAGRRQVDIARAAGISDSALSRLELGQTADLSYEVAAAIGSVVGLRLSLRAYPGDRVLLDDAQIHLLRQLRDRLGPEWRWRYEVPVAPGDPRAWDMVGRHATTGQVIVVEAETRVRDLQALLRRFGQKRDASGGPRIVLLVAGTRNNRVALVAGRDELAAEFPVSTRRALLRLAAGGDPGADCLIVL